VKGSFLRRRWVIRRPVQNHPNPHQQHFARAIAVPHRSSKEICKFRKSLVKSWPQSSAIDQWGIRLQNCATLRYIENNQDVALSNFLDGTYLKIEAGWDNVEELS